VTRSVNINVKNPCENYELHKSVAADAGWVISLLWSELRESN
jgi:hypothetical protein